MFYARIVPSSSFFPRQLSSYHHIPCGHNLITSLTVYTREQQPGSAGLEAGHIFPTFTRQSDIRKRLRPENHNIYFVECLRIKECEWKFGRENAE